MRFDAPINPSAGDGTAQLRRELAKPIYREQQDPLWMRVLNWIFEHLIPQGSGAGGAFGNALLIALLLAVFALVLYAIPRIRRTRSTSDHHDHAVLDDLDVSADQLRGQAAAAYARGDFDSAVLNCFRAIAKTADDRTIIELTAGMTAHEAGAQLMPAFPHHVDRVHSAAARFDAIRYGDQHAGRAAADELTRLDDELRRTKPHAAARLP